MSVVILKLGSSSVGFHESSQRKQDIFDVHGVVLIRIRFRGKLFMSVVNQYFLEDDSRIKWWNAFDLVLPTRLIH